MAQIYSSTHAAGSPGSPGATFAQADRANILDAMKGNIFDLVTGITAIAAAFMTYRVDPKYRQTASITQTTR